MYTLSDLAPLCTPHGGLAAFQSRYPINFVVKHPNPLFRREGPALRLMKPATDPKIAACFEIEVSIRIKREGSDLEAAKSDLVELTGIEPVTPCLQSRCSPS